MQGHQLPSNPHRIAEKLGAPDPGLHRQSRDRPGTGKLPQDGDSKRELLESASETRYEFNSAFAAARGQPDKARDKLFHEGSNEYREAATFFAERTIELVNFLAGAGQ